jgi:hypothetical protein
VRTKRTQAYLLVAVMTASVVARTATTTTSTATKTAPTKVTRHRKRPKHTANLRGRVGGRRGRRARGGGGGGADAGAGGDTSTRGPVPLLAALVKRAVHTGGAAPAVPEKKTEAARGSARGNRIPYLALGCPYLTRTLLWLRIPPIFVDMRSIADNKSPNHNTRTPCTVA